MFMSISIAVLVKMENLNSGMYESLCKYNAFCFPMLSMCVFFCASVLGLPDLPMESGVPPVRPHLPTANQLASRRKLIPKKREHHLMCSKESISLPMSSGTDIITSGMLGQCCMIES